MKISGSKALSRTTAVVGSGVSTSLIALSAPLKRLFSFVADRRMLYFTSSEVSARPFTGATLWNFALSRRWNTISVGPGISHERAMSG